MDKEDKDSKNPLLYMNEASISVMLTSFMTAVVIFFIGLLLTGDAKLQIRLRVPLVLLFFSAFGFLYSTLIYANASGEIARLKKNMFDRQMTIGNILSEFFGVYCLVFAVPIVVLGYSPDKILSFFVLIISLLSFLIYHLMGYSILERYMKRASFYITLLFMLITYIICFTFFYLDIETAFYAISLILIFQVIGLVLYLLKHKES